MKIANLTQHKATAEQIAAGVVDLCEGLRELLIEGLTFDELPSASDIASRASDIADLVIDHGEFEAAMIGGAPFLMAPLERALKTGGVKVFYAFSVRESVEEAQVDGSVKKINVFRHAGFVEV